MLDGDSYRWFDFQTLPSSGTKNYLIRTCPNPFDLFFYGRVFSGNRTDLKLEVFANPTFSSEGVLMADRIFNRNGSSSKTAQSQVWQNPVISDSGILIDYDSIPGSQGPQQGSAGSESSQEFPRIIPNDIYLLARVTNLSSTNQGSYTYKLFFSEVRQD